MLIFFLQAEDGIRDGHVTGVQTCALPIFAERYRAQSQRVRGAGVRVAALSSVLEALQILLPGLFIAAVVWLGARLEIGRASCRVRRRINEVGVYINASHVAKQE